MKTARLVILGIALVAGGAAAMLVNRAPRTENRPVAAGPSIELTKVLVAAGDIGVGSALTANDMRWQDWPKSAVNAGFLTTESAPTGIEEWTGAVARSGFVAGEPLKPTKLIKGNGSGFLSAILPAGMRAVATKIAVETAAGGFILPNDRVDVVLTRRDAETSRQTGSEAWAAETILRNIRILAIDQTIEDQNGQKVLTGSTATLELTQRQGEILALAREMGTISLTLRSLADSTPTSLAGEETALADKAQESDQGGLSIVRFGVTTNVVNR